MAHLSPCNQHTLLYRSVQCSHFNCNYMVAAYLVQTPITTATQCSLYALEASIISVLKQLQLHWRTWDLVPNHFRTAFTLVSPAWFPQPQSQTNCSFTGAHGTSSQATSGRLSHQHGFHISIASTVPQKSVYSAAYFAAAAAYSPF